MPFTAVNTRRAPSRGVAETLLHETAGRGSRLWGLGSDGRHDDGH
jgi:hypothetical protein